MNYQVVIEEKAARDTKSIPKKDLQRIDGVILKLCGNPRPPGCKKLTEKEGYRVRVGRYRILYRIDDRTKVVIVYRIRKKDERTYE